MENIYENILKMCMCRNIKITEKPDIAKILQYNLITISGEYIDRVEEFRCYLIPQNSEVMSKKSSFLEIYNFINSAEQSINIMIVSYEPAPTVRKLIDDLLSKDNVHIELLRYAPFVIEVPKHSMAVPHVVLNAEQKTELETELRGFTLPKILEKDPMVIWIGGRRGDIIKIDRLSEISGVITAYRKVVAS